MCDKCSQEEMERLHEETCQTLEALVKKVAAGISYEGHGVPGLEKDAVEEADALEQEMTEVLRGVSSIAILARMAFILDMMQVKVREIGMQRVQPKLEQDKVDDFLQNLIVEGMSLQELTDHFLDNNTGT